MASREGRRVRLARIAATFVSSSPVKALGLSDPVSGGIPCAALDSGMWEGVYRPCVDVDVLPAELYSSQLAYCDSESRHDSSDIAAGPGCAGPQSDHLLRSSKDHDCLLPSRPVQRTSKSFVKLGKASYKAGRGTKVPCRAGLAGEGGLRQLLSAQTAPRNSLAVPSAKNER